MITHEEVLNQLLANSCFNPSETPGFNTYSIELCCTEFEITARPVGNYKYEILEVK